MDECKEDNHDCDPNANCTNTYGSYKCTCMEGYTGDGHSCAGKLSFINQEDIRGCFSLIVLVTFCKTVRHGDGKLYQGIIPYFVSSSNF